MADGDRTEYSEARRLDDEGLDYYLKGDLQRAAESFRKALELSPDSKAALYSLGMVSGQLGRFEESRDYFSHLVRILDGEGDAIDPTMRSAARGGLGAAFLSLWGAANQEAASSLAQQAEGEFRVATALDPASSGGWVGLGISLHMVGRLEDAERALREAIEINPEDTGARERLQDVLEDKLERRLFELGYLSKLNEPIRDFTPYDNRIPIEVKGKPLSEIVVEDRR
ncbi:MAG TPA: tetratricopeptide repeat protein [Blastocatellia bacterium]|jgi:tetratricopeptide (TPR) repeat protein|nr:tetratricopeptide repeat protein [Blastocatellia bacterium]